MARRDGLTIERWDSPAHGEEIKALFRRENRAEFAAVFDRAYPYAYSAGGASWVTRDANGTVVGHIAAFPRVFNDGSRPARAALLVDCLFDCGYRNFLWPLELCRRAVADLRASQSFDFVYSDPTPPAIPVVRAVGLVACGQWQRLAMPAHPLYVLPFGLRVSAQRLSVETVPDSHDPRVVQALPRLTGGGFRAARSPELYATRLGGPDIPSGQWLVFRPGSEPTAHPVALVLTVREPGNRTLTIVDVLWDPARVFVESVLVATARTAWLGGHTRLSMTTLVPSEFAASQRRCGFIRRPDVLPLLVLRLGTVPLPPCERWHLTMMDGSGW